MLKTELVYRQHFLRLNQLTFISFHRQLFSVYCKVLDFTPSYNSDFLWHAGILAIREHLRQILRFFIFALILHCYSNAELVFIDIMAKWLARGPFEWIIISYNVRTIQQTAEESTKLSVKCCDHSFIVGRCYQSVSSNRPVQSSKLPPRPRRSIRTYDIFIN